MASLASFVRISHRNLELRLEFYEREWIGRRVLLSCTIGEVIEVHFCLELFVFSIELSR